LKRLEENGFAIIDGVLPSDVVAELIRAVETEVPLQAARGGVRNLLEFPVIRGLADTTTVRALVEPVLGAGAFPVRGILFDKTDGANWKVPWHQDVTIAVRNRMDVDGFGPWSMKAGVLHVQPPAVVLEQMLTVRLHLDDCLRENGALRVLPGTHRNGKIPETEVANWTETVPEAVCELKAGGALLMRPLLLHASSVATRVGHRRVIHLDFAAVELPVGLEWAER
jgi:hypothetical protein